MIITTLSAADICKQQIIAIGRQLEDNYRQIIFDCSGFGDGITGVTLVHQRKADVAPYIVTTSDTDTLTWTITDTDTSYYGYGKGELRISFADGLAKSIVFTTLTVKSITADTTIPEPLQSWYDAMIEYIDDHAVTIDEVDELVQEYLEEHPISAPVTSVNNKTGAVVLTASDVGALPSSTTIPSKVSQLQNDSGYQTASQVDNAIDAKLSATYKAGGSIAFNQLPVPSETYLGMVYDITDAFTTTPAFIEGAGVDYPAGTDVAIILNNENYYYDVLSGFVDLSNYATLTDLNGKQDALTAGTNITINGTTISATDTNTTYTISISGNVITLTPSTGQAQTITLPADAVTSVNGRTGAVTGLAEAWTIENKTSADTSVTLSTGKFYIFPEMSSLAVTVTASGMYAFRFTSGTTPTTLTVTGATMPDSFTVEASKVYEVNVYQGYAVVTSWTAS